MAEEAGAQSSYLVNLKNDLKNASQKLLAIFKLILKGDEMASNFMLYNFLSKVYQRTPEGTAMGHLNLNISGLDAKQAHQVSALMKHILPLQLSIKLSIQSISEMKFVPKKNYDTDQMEPGLF